jgi:hypothetical protein
MTESNKLSDQITEALVSLGSSKEEVCIHLKELGITGQPGYARDCPIANYLKIKFPQEDCFGVTHNWVKVNELKVVLPKVIHEFIVAFDTDKYPELLKQEI